jgi:thiosulfate/3-mercaptopyruvate sulfurtransferase
MKYLVAILLLSSCSYLVKMPTTSRETYPRPKFASAIEVKEKDVLLDARPFFYYSSSHISGAYHDDIAKYFDKKTTWPKKDLFSESRTLARKGVNPKQRVLVVGQGRQGRGEECRLAWNLFYLGIEDVHFLKEETIKAKRVTEANPALQEEPVYWQPEYKAKLLIERADLIKDIQNKKSFKVIDARKESDFLKSAFPWDPEVDVQVINIYWKDFLLEKDGRPDIRVGNKLENLKINKNDTIIVIDDDGIGASCAAMALMDFGFKKVRLYAGGYNDLRQILQN